MGSLCVVDVPGDSRALTRPDPILVQLACDDGGILAPGLFAALCFSKDVAPTKLCSQTLDRETALVFSASVEVHYW